MQSNITIQLATENDLDAMIQVGDTLFDYPVKTNRAKEFLNDPRHHLVLAYDQDQLVGMASGFHYIHPDKDPALFVNEVSVIETHQNQKIGRSLVLFLCNYAKTALGCHEAWIATESGNLPAQKAYLAAGGIQDPESIVLYAFDLNQ